MNAQQAVAPHEVQGLIELSAVRNTPAAITCQFDDVWRSYHSRFLGVRNSELWIEYASADPPVASPELVVGQTVGVAFKQRHHKYVFTTRILRIADFRIAPDTSIRGLCIEWPEAMRRLQRRIFERVNIPPDRPVFVKLQQPQLPGAKALNGQLVDLSAGGLRVRLLENSEPKLNVGDAIAVELRPRGQSEPIRVEALFRHSTQDEFGLTLGLQLAGLMETAQGVQALEQISSLLSQYQGRRRRR